MDSVAQKTQSPMAVEIDGIPHRQCGEGRKQRRAGSEECGRILPLDQFVINNGYTDGHGLICKECADKQNARYTERVKSALVPIKVYEDVPIGSGTCRGVAIEINGEHVPHLVVIEACRYWGLDGQGQIQRIEDDPILSAGLVVCKIHTTGGAKPAYALRYDLVPAWLAGIETAKMRNRERATQLAAYQRVCAQVLADYFFGTKTAPPSPAQRIEHEGSIAGWDGMQVIAYMDAALSSVVAQAVTPLYQKLGMLDLLPPIYENTRQSAVSLLGAKRIEIEIPAPIVNGEVYFEVLNSRLMITALEEDQAHDWANVPNLVAMLRKGMHCFIFGETTRGRKKRVKEHAGKNRIGSSIPVRPAITTDCPKALQDLFRERRPGSVLCVPSTDDLFVVPESVLNGLRSLPDYMTLKAAKWHLRTGWIWEKEL